MGLLLSGCVDAHCGLLFRWSECYLVTLAYETSYVRGVERAVCEVC